MQWWHCTGACAVRKRVKGDPMYVIVHWDQPLGGQNTGALFLPGTYLTVESVKQDMKHWHIISCFTEQLKYVRLVCRTVRVTCFTSTRWKRVQTANFCEYIISRCSTHEWLWGSLCQIILATFYCDTIWMYVFSWCSTQVIPRIIPSDRPSHVLRSQHNVLWWNVQKL